MKFVAAAVVVCLVFTGIAFSADSTQLSSPSAVANLATLPLAFIENRGQWPDSIRFRADAPGTAIWFTDQGTYYQFTRPTGRSGDSPGASESTTIRAVFRGTNPAPEISGGELQVHRCHYFIGDDPAAWRVNVPTYASITRRQLYSGIDLTVYGRGAQLEYDLILAPGADPGVIRIAHEGARLLAVDADGRLVITTDWGEMIERQPVIFQEIGGERCPVDGRYVLLDEETFGFELTGWYDRSLALVIDPILDFSTFLGAGAGDYADRVTVDDSGCIYIAGATASTNFPLLNPCQSTYGGGYFDAFVVKLNSAGTALLSSTFLGGNREDFAKQVLVDTDGSMIVVGESFSANFPVRNGLQMTYGGGQCDGYLARLSPAGDTLRYSTYLGGSGADYATVIALADDGGIAIAGSTASADFPTYAAVQPTLGGGNSDAFVAEINRSGDSLRFSTYLGGTGTDWGRCITRDAQDRICVGGYTSSPDFPTLNAFQATRGGGMDAFVSRFSADGRSLLSSTFLGGTFDDSGFGIAVDSGGAIYLCGNTASSNFPTVGAFQANSHGGTDGFVSKLDSTASVLLYSTYLGGSSDDYGQEIVVDDSGCALVAGYTSSGDFPTVWPFQATNHGSNDVFLVRLNSAGDGLTCGTYLGGSYDDTGWGIARYDSGHVIVSGRSNSPNFPVQNALQPIKSGSYDIIVTRFTASYFRDTDGDTVPDAVDNCLVTSNPGQEDTDGDGIGNACCCVLRGDVTGDGVVVVSDITFLVDYLFRGAADPGCPPQGDVDADGRIVVSDLTYLVRYIFQGGATPLPCA